MDTRLADFSFTQRSSLSEALGEDPMLLSVPEALYLSIKIKIKLFKRRQNVAQQQATNHFVVLTSI